MSSQEVVDKGKFAAALELPPEALIPAVARAGFRATGLRINPVSEGGVCYPLPPGSGDQPNIEMASYPQGKSSRAARLGRSIDEAGGRDRVCDRDDRCRDDAYSGLLQSRCRIAPCNGIIRARSKSTPARPYIARLSPFSLLI
jgi:hypothetical protein